MFREKNFLVEKGIVSKNCRKDTVWMIGTVYDKLSEKKEITIVDIQRMEEAREFLNENRQNINGDTYDIVSLTHIIDILINKVGCTTNVTWEEIEKIQRVLTDTRTDEQIETDKKVYRVYTKNKKPDWYYKNGIYGIFANDECIYVGKTTNGFGRRLNSHRNHYINGEHDKVYNVMRLEANAGKKLTARPLIIVEDIPVKHKSNYSNNEIECMEMALIHYLRPMGNIAGITKPYIFSGNQGEEDRCKANKIKS